MLRPLLLAAALCVAGALAQAAPALAAFGPVEPVSAGDAEFVRMDTAPSGTSLLVWTRKVGTTRRVEARFRSLNGTYGPVLPLSDPSVNTAVPEVAVDDAGNGVVAWDLNGGPHIQIQARVVNANGTLGPVKNVTDGHADAFEPQVGMGSTGPALIAWTTLDPVPSERGLRIQATTMTLTSSVAPRQLISFSGLAANEPDVAVNPDGRGVVAWHVDRGVDEFIDTRGWERGAGFGTIRTLGPFGVRNRDPAAAVNGDGSTFVAWNHLNSNGSISVQGIAGTVVEPGGVTLVKISAPDVLGGGPPTVGLDDDGDALVAWDRKSSPTTLQVRARQVAADGSLGSGTAVSGAVTVPGETSLFPRLALTPAGFAMVAWQQHDPGAGHQQVHVRARRIDGTWANQQTLATTGKARLPQITLDPAGDALAACTGTAGSGTPIIQAAAQPR